MAIRIQIMRILSVDSKKFPPRTSLTKKLLAEGIYFAFFRQLFNYSFVKSLYSGTHLTDFTALGTSSLEIVATF